jgi:hypothetical protein
MTSHIRSRNVRCIICQFNKLTEFEGVTPDRNIEINTMVTAGRTDQTFSMKVGHAWQI